MIVTNMSAEELINYVSMLDNPSDLEKALCEKLAECVESISNISDALQKVVDIADEVLN